MLECETPLWCCHVGTINLMDVVPNHTLEYQLCYCVRTRDIVWLVGNLNFCSPILSIHTYCWPSVTVLFLVTLPPLTDSAEGVAECWRCCDSRVSWPLQVVVPRGAVQAVPAHCHCRLHSRHSSEWQHGRLGRVAHNAPPVTWHRCSVPGGDNVLMCANVRNC